MKTLNTIILVSICALFLSCDKSKTLIQPKINKQPKTYTYFGETIVDPYSNLEDLKDSLVLDWIKHQTIYTNEVIRNNRSRYKILELENELENEKQNSSRLLKITHNDKHFYIKKKPSDSIYKLYYKNGFNGEEKILLDPNKLKTNTSINYIQPNHDGSKIVVNLTKNDAEIGDIYIVDVINNSVLKDVLTNCWPSALTGVKWLTDNNSFIYSYIPVIDSNSEDFILNTASLVYNIGDNPKKHNVLLSKKHNSNLDIVSADFPITSIRNQNEKYLFGRIAGARNFDDYYFATDFSKSDPKWKSLYKKEDKIYDFVIDDSDNLYFMTAKNASNYKIGKTSLTNPNFKDYETLVEEDSKAVITDMVITSQGLFFVKTKNGIEARLYQLKNEKIIEIPIPKPSGSISLTSNGSKFEQLWIVTEGWLNKFERYKYDFENQNFITNDIDTSSPLSEKLKEFVVKEIEISSHDGVMIPLSIIHKKNISLSSQNAVFITGYGAYGVSEKPYLSSYMYHWVNNGGVYAIAHVRGGGEKGDKWHEGGQKLTKPNSWKDFIACTEYLIHKKYTSPDKIAVRSASAGGVLIGRAITERPDLYAAAIIQVGALNMLKSEFAPNGKNNIKEFGTVKDSLGFKGLYEMDSYHHIKNGEKYPAIYVTGGLNDSRVPAWEPAKFAARMQDATTSNKPVLLAIDFEGGHGVDASENKQNEEFADILTFALWQTGHPDFKPKK